MQFVVGAWYSLYVHCIRCVHMQFVVGTKHTIRCMHMQFVVGTKHAIHCMHMQFVVGTCHVMVLCLHVMTVVMGLCHELSLLSC